MVSVAAPLLSDKFPEIGAEPSKNTIVPVAEAGVTLAVNVSELPNTDGLVPALKLTDVTEFTFGLFTVWDNAAEVEPLKLALPPYCAVMECIPKDNCDVVMLAVPPVRVTSPEMALLPSKKTTVPLAEVGVTFAVKVRASPTRDGFAPVVKATLMLVLGLLIVCVSGELTEELSLLSPV